MTEIDSISKMIGEKNQDCVQCPEYLLLFNVIRGNTFFIKRFSNTINAVRTTVQYAGYSWATFNSFVLLIQCSPAFSKHTVYTLQNNKYYNKECNIVNTWPLVGTG